MDAKKSSKVLIAYASKHGSTKEIAERIYQVLLRKGVAVELRNIEEPISVANYRAFIIGSAVYAGNWRSSAKKFIDSNKEFLVGKPVWLFSTGPVGDPLKPSIEKSVQIKDISKEVKPYGHYIFGGKIQKEKLSLTEKTMLKAVGAQDGDYRDWAEVQDWAERIAKALK